MARVEGVEGRHAGPLARLAFWLSKRMFGRVADPLRVTAHNPWIFRAYSSYEWAFGKARKVDPKLKSLAELKAAAMVGCPF